MSVHIIFLPFSKRKPPTKLDSGTSKKYDERSGNLWEQIAGMLGKQLLSNAIGLYC